MYKMMETGDYLFTFKKIVFAHTHIRSSVIERGLVDILTDMIFKHTVVFKK